MMIYLGLWCSNIRKYKARTPWIFAVPLLSRWKDQSELINGFRAEGIFATRGNTEPVEYFLSERGNDFEH